MLIWRQHLNPGAEITGFFAAIRETALTSEKDVGKDKPLTGGCLKSFLMLKDKRVCTHRVNQPIRWIVKTARFVLNHAGHNNPALAARTPRKIDLTLRHPLPVVGRGPGG